MGSKRKKYLIDEIKASGKYSCVGGPFGSSLTQAHYVDFEAVPVIRGTNLTNDEFQDTGFVYVSEDKGDELNKNMAFPGDIIFTQRGTLGQVALIPMNAKYSRYVVSQSQMKLTVNPDIADSYFIYSYFRSKEAKKYIELNAIVGGVPHINLGILKNIEINLPPLEIQKKIVGVLRNLDDKITLNRQINQTLEQMAQTLFKAWFVDFDPVIDNALDAGNEIPDTLQERAEQRRLLRAKADFQPLPAETRALFPSEFEETELGWVPKGWEVGCIADFGSIVCGKTPSKDKNEFYGGTIPFIKIPDMHNQVFIVETSDSLSLDGSNSQIKKLIPKDSICVSCIATVGLVAIANKASHTNQQINSIVPFKPYFRDYLYFSMMDKYELFHDLASGGSTTLNMNTSTFSKIQMLKPANEILLSYQKLSSSFLSKNLANELESQSLIKIRDTLLPKLISGELALDALPEVPELAEAR